MISLIVATLDRVAELDRLLASLDRQTYRDFEVIVVDQNADDRLVPVLGNHSGLAIRHLRSDRGLSRGRNVGLRAAQGSVIAIPDDDCWYPESLLATITSWLEANSELQLLCVVKRNAKGEPIGTKPPSTAQTCTRQTVWVALSSAVFMQRRVCDVVGEFNESIGVGAPTRYQSGEETDYFLRAIEAGFRMHFDPAITVYHSDLDDVERLRRKIYPYALGSGYVLRSHGYKWHELGGILARSFGGAAVSLGRGNVSLAHIYLLRAVGQLRGYVCGPRDLARLGAARMH